MSFCDMRRLTPRSTRTDTLVPYTTHLRSGVWEPFFQGSPTDPQNGTEEIITSSVSEAWPVPDAAIGGYTYALEILTGIVRSDEHTSELQSLMRISYAVFCLKQKN